MNFFFGAVLVVLIGVSFIADYKWRQWVKSRDQVREMERQLDSISTQGTHSSPNIL
jgi:hypothetical protein